MAQQDGFDDMFLLNASADLRRIERSLNNRRTATNARILRRDLAGRACWAIVGCLVLATLLIGRCPPN